MKCTVYAAAVKHQTEEQRRRSSQLRIGRGRAAKPRLVFLVRYEYLHGTSNFLSFFFGEHGSHSSSGETHKNALIFQSYVTKPDKITR